MKTPKLKDQRVKDRIVGDVLEQVREGSLQAGDKLAPVRRLCSLYGVSQRIVDQAKADLVERGVIENRPRSGSYILPPTAAMLRPAGDRVSAPEPAAEAPASKSQTEQLFDFYLPRVQQCTLNVYVCEVLETNIDLWRVMLQDFCETRPHVEINMLSCRDGHLTDLLKEQDIDLVQATPVLLRAIGRERFVDLSRFIERLATTDDLLDIIPCQPQFAKDFIGVPFSISLSYLYVNQDLLNQHGLAEFHPETATEMFSQLADIGATLQANNRIAMAGPGFNECLFMGRGLHFDEGGNLLVDVSRATKILEMMRQPGLFRIPDGGDLAGFLRGEAAVMINNSFHVVKFQEEDLGVRWRVLPAPVDADARMPAMMTVLAIQEGAVHRQEAINLAAYLLTRRTQTEFGRLPGNLPVLRSALERPPLVDPHVMPQDTRTQALKRSTLMWNESSRTRFHAHGGLAGMQAIDLLAGRLTPREAVERLWLMSH